VVLDEPKPGPEPLDMFPRGSDPAPQVIVFSLERTDPEPGLGELRPGMAALSLPGALRQLGFRALAASSPRGELLFDRREELLQLLEDDAISSCVG
jgi:hypothetical protein